MTTATTVDDFLADVKAAAQVPSAEGRVTSAEILRMADQLLVRAIGRAVYDADDGRWAVTASLVPVTSGVAAYRLPARAWAGGLRAVTLVQTATGDAVPLDYVDNADIEIYACGSWQRPVYTLEGDSIVLLPTPTDSAYSLRVRYVRRPSRMALVADCALITAVTSSTITATYPTAWTDATIADVVRGTYHATPLEDDVGLEVTPTATIARDSGTWATTGALAIEAGDYVCLAGYTCVPQVPEVALGWLTELTARDVCVALGDTEGAGARAQLASAAAKDVEQSIAERSRTRPVVFNRNSPLRSAGMGGVTRRFGR